jgi:5-(aminomethyl)-3-furanmethanol phosphate kinase
MNRPDPVNAPDVVAKVGGSLLDVPDLRDRLRRWLAGLGTARVLLVPGGGAFADVVRQLDRTYALGGAASHWLALKTVDLNGEVLNCLLGQRPGAARTEELARFWEAKAVPVLGIIQFALVDKDRPDTLPANWTVSSDSIAARIATVTGARRLVLLKSTDLPAGIDWEEAGRLGYVDGYFATAVRQRPGLAVEWVNLRA